MAVVLVHGNPETDAVWRPLVGELGRDDVTCLSPPGFGAPVPDGFGATYLDYRDWLVGELERFDAPVDLVGHDWGGGHVVNVAMIRPDLYRRDAPRRGGSGRSPGRGAGRTRPLVDGAGPGQGARVLTEFWASVPK